MKRCVMISAIVAAAGATAMAQDGSNIQADAAANSLALLGVQDTPTGFGNAVGGGQDSAGGSEVNAMWGTISGGKLLLSVTGNLEANFNKLWIFFDAVAGGENTLLNDNVDGGFGEINNMAGLTFDTGFEPDHFLRMEVGGGFGGIRFGDLIDNTGGDVWTFNGTGDLPLATGVGGFGIVSGWNNANILGVDGASAAGALTADLGWEFEIDLMAAFGIADASAIGVSVILSNDNGGFLSNQVLGETGVGGAGNLGGGAGVNFNQYLGNQFAVVVPTPGAFALLGLGGLAAARRRRG